MADFVAVSGVAYDDLKKPGEYQSPTMAQDVPGGNAPIDFKLLPLTLLVKSCHNCRHIVCL